MDTRRIVRPSEVHVLETETMSALQTTDPVDYKGDTGQTETNHEKMSIEKAAESDISKGYINYGMSLEDIAYCTSVEDMSMDLSVDTPVKGLAVSCDSTNSNNACESLEDLAYGTSIEDIASYTSDDSEGCTTNADRSYGNECLQATSENLSSSGSIELPTLPASASCETLNVSLSLEAEPPVLPSNQRAETTPDDLTREDTLGHLQHEDSSVSLSSDVESHADPNELREEVASDEMTQEDKPGPLQHDVPSVAVSSEVESHIHSSTLGAKTTPVVMVQEKTQSQFQQKTSSLPVERGAESFVVQRKTKAVPNERLSSSRDPAKVKDGITTDIVTKDDPNSKDEEKVRLKKELGLFGGISFIVGCIIGSGIFVSPKGVLIYSGSISMSLAVWLSSGLMTLVGAICYAELGTMFPQSGGVYTYLHESCGSVPAFIYLWMALFILQPANKVVDSLTFANYFLQPFFPDCEAPPDGAVRLLAASAICILAWINCTGVKRAATVMEVLSVAKVGALISIILVGIYHLATGNTQNYNNVTEGTNWGATYVASAFYQSLFTFDGWDHLNMVTEELKDPHKTLPRAIILSISGVTVIYLLANVAYFAVLTPSEILSSSAIAVTYGNRVFGVMAWIIPVFVACSTIGSVNGAIFTHSRMVFVGARRGHLPKFLTIVNVDKYTPVPAILFMTSITLLMFVTSEIRGLINYISFANSLTTLAVTTGLLWMRYKKPDFHRPIKVWLVFPVIFWCCCVFLVVFPVVQQPVEIAMAIGVIITGLIVYYFAIHRERSKKFHSVMDKMNYTCQLLLRGIVEEKED